MKKTALTLLVTLMVIQCFVSVGCNSADQNITGNWKVDFQLGDDSGSFNIAFSGTKTAGLVIYNNLQSGEYSVYENEVEFVVRLNVVGNDGSILVVYAFSGSFQDGERMSGTMNVTSTGTSEVVSGTWSAEAF